MARRLKAIADHIIVLEDGQLFHAKAGQILPPHVQDRVLKSGDLDLYEWVGDPEPGGCEVSDHADLLGKLAAAEARAAALQADLDTARADLESVTAPPPAVPDDPAPKRRGTIN